MKVYAVGGQVRDKLLGIPNRDHDYVVVGATPQQMKDLGYTQVGAGFPVFLDETGEEYALARTERKIGHGYQGFETFYDSSVTLEEDLKRRDLTINSMAMDLETGEIIDPYGGRFDLANKILRHTSEAFAEDPVRVLRTARFAARYGFNVDLETHRLMIIIAPELIFVPYERIWMEFEKGLMERYPEKMILVLTSIGVLSRTLRPYYGAINAVDYLRKVDQSDTIEIRFALLASEFTKEDYEVFKIPNSCRDVSVALNKYKPLICDYDLLSAEERLDLLMKLKAHNNTTLINRVVRCVEIMYGVRHTVQIYEDLAAIRTVDAASIAANYKDGATINKEIFKARVAAMEALV